MTSIVPTVIRVAVTLLAIAGVAGHVAYLDALWWHALGLTETMARDVRPSLLTLLTAHAIVSIVCAVFAVALVLNEGPRQAAARALGAAFGAWSYLMAYSGVTLLYRPAPGPGREVFEGHFLLVEMIGLAALLRFTSLFPRRLDPDELAVPPTLPAVFHPFHAISVAMLRPAAPWVGGLVVLVTLWTGTLVAGRPLSDAGLSRVMDLVRLGAAGLVVVSLYRSWGRADPEGRERLEWLVVGLAFLFGSLALLIGGNVLVAVTRFAEPDVAWRPLLLDLGLIGFLSGLALSVLHAGGARPFLVFRTVASTSAVITLGLFLAAGLEALFSGGILATYSLRTGVGSALAIATIVSTHRGIVRFIHRMMPQA